MKKFNHNVAYNLTGFFISVACAFIISPITVNLLGAEVYGIWSLLISFTGHYGLLTFGLQSALSRYLAYALSRKDSQSANQYFNTALLALNISALVTVVAGVVLGFTLHYFVEIPENQLSATRYSCILISLSAGLTFFNAPFQGILLGLRRFELVNFVGIGSTIIRTLLVYLLLINGFGLLQMALLHFAITLCIAVFQAVLARRIFPDLVINFRRNVTWKCFMELIKFGLKTFAISSSTVLIYQCDLFVIGTFLTPDKIAFYSLGLTLITYYIQLIDSGVRVLTTHLVGIFSRKGLQGIRKVFLTGSMLLYMVAGFVIVGCVMYGSQFYTLWIGPDYSESARIMVLLMIPQFFATGTRICTSLFIATDNVGKMAKFAVLEGWMNLILSLILVRFKGLYGVALGTIIPNMIYTLIILPWFALHQLHIPWFRYFYRSMIPGFLMIFFCWVISCGVQSLSGIDGWGGFAVRILLTTLGCSVAGWGILKLYGVRLQKFIDDIT